VSGIAELSTETDKIVLLLNYMIGLAFVQNLL